MRRARVTEAVTRASGYLQFGCEETGAAFSIAGYVGCSEECLDERVGFERGAYLHRALTLAEILVPMKEGGEGSTRRKTAFTFRVRHAITAWHFQRTTCCWVTSAYSRVDNIMTLW